MTDNELRALWRYVRSAPHDSLRWRHDGRSRREPAVVVAAKEEGAA